VKRWHNILLIEQVTLIIGFVTRLTRRVSLVEQELPTRPEHLSLPPEFSGVYVTRSLILYVCFVDRCLSFCTFSFGHCVVCSSSSIYGFWLPLWYLKLFLHVLWSTCMTLYKVFGYYNLVKIKSDILITSSIKMNVETVEVLMSDIKNIKKNIFTK
jgi:hypothetical protein